MTNVVSLADIKVYPKPQTPGFYWARSGNHLLYYDTIVYICGDVPYLRYSSRNVHTGEIRQGSDPEFFFGPEITRPEIELKGEEHEMPN